MSEGQELTFVSTDVVGSSALYRRFPNDMPVAMDLHDQILKAAIHRHQGNPFKHTGDGVLAAFHRTDDAVRAVVDAQREMRAARWGTCGRLLLRCGIHTGLARQRGDDFFGPALSTVSRLEGAANAEQILISDSSVERLHALGEPKSVSFSDLGRQHFKGIDEIRVYQVCAEGLPQAFPPIGGKRETASGNLPANLSTFIGRERELEELLALTREARLLTLLGPGGMGKTRLAIELARRLAPAFADGAWLVDLAALERDGDVWPTIAASLLLEPQSGVDPRFQVLTRLRDARAVLLMDNCEHVLDRIAGAVAELGARCGELFIVNTSRRTLGLDGEAPYQVGSLALESGQDPLQSAAVQLFIARARLTQHRFQPSTQELVTIETLCNRLENIPLAIEFAAGNLRRLSLGQLAEGLVNPLELRAAGTQRKASRQQTLGHTLRWSYDLLAPGSRAVLRRLAVFSGPFQEEQALALCEGDFPSELDVLDGIDELVDSSLMSRDTGSGHRLRMLQTVQAFGRKELEDEGVLDAVERRHGQVFAARARELGDQVCGADEALAVQAVYDELPNLRAAFERALVRDLDLAARLATSLYVFSYSHRGAETAGWFRRIAGRPGAEELPCAALVLAGAAGEAFHSNGDAAAAKVFLERGFRAEAAGRESSRGWLSGVAGQVAQWSNDDQTCLLHLNASIAQARAEGDVACELTSLCMAANVKVRARDREAASELVELATRLGQSVHCPTLLAYVYFARGRVASLDSAHRAIDEYRIGVEWAAMAGNHEGAVRIKHFLAETQASCASPAEAVQILVQLLTEMPAHGAAYFFYAWVTIKSLLLPLASLQADECLGVLAGAVGRSPAQMRRVERAAVEAARARVGAGAFDPWVARGALFDQVQTRAYCIDVVAARAREIA